jgi:hypothetical protein
MVTVADLIEFEGKMMSYENAKLILAARNQATLGAVNTLASAESSKVILAAQALEQQAFGGYARTIVPGLVQKWGAVNATAAVRYYSDSRDLWYRTYGSAITGRDQAYARSTRYATAKTKGMLYKATVPGFDSQAISDPIINGMMAKFSTNGPEEAARFVENAITRAVGAYNRDTLLFNAGLDENVDRVQRVAEPNACAWCARWAVTGYGRRTTFTSDYAVSWHNKCKCSIEVLFRGDPLIRPPYYDQMEAEWADTQDEAIVRAKYGRK